MKTESLDIQHDTFSRNTRNQLRQVFDALRELTTPLAPAPKRPIGFVHPEDKPPPHDQQGQEVSVGMQQVSGQRKSRQRPQNIAAGVVSDGFKVAIYFVAGHARI